MLPLLLLAAGLLAPTSAPGCATVLPASPQSHFGSVHGQITDVYGGVIPHAQVLLKSASGERSYKHADDNGCYSFNAPPGDYILFARCDGFRNSSVSLHLSQGMTEVENLSLKIGTCDECIKVEGTGKMYVQVQDPAGTPLASSVVVLEPAGRGRKTIRITVQLDDWGRGGVDVPIGKYLLRVSATDFTSIKRAVRIRYGQEYFQHIELAPGQS